MTAVSPQSLYEFHTKAEFPSSLPLAKSEVEKIPRWDLISRISRLEDTYFTRSDAEAMEARTIKREEDMEDVTASRIRAVTMPHSDTAANAKERFCSGRKAHVHFVYFIADMWRV